MWLQIGHCSDVATKLATWEGRKKIGLVLGGVLGTVKRPGKALAAVQNALVCLSGIAESEWVAGVQSHCPSLVCLECL